MENKKPLIDMKTNLSFEVKDSTDNIPFMKADIVKAVEMGGNLAIAFYQIDYVATARHIAIHKENNPESYTPSTLIPVAKVVLDIEAMKRLKSELSSLLEGVE